MVQASISPIKLEWLEKNSEFSVSWNDGHQSSYSLISLREACPCALCREERINPDPLKIMKTLPSGLKTVSIDTVGNYAIKLTWSDGHSTGIYTFDFLRNYCPCNECKPS